MSMQMAFSIPKLRGLPESLPMDGAIRLELEEGVPILRASSSVQKRVRALLQKEKEFGLSKEESEEFDRYEEIDDYLSLLNRLVRNHLSENPTREN